MPSRVSSTPYAATSVTGTRTLARCGRPSRENTGTGVYAYRTILVMSGGTVRFNSGDGIYGDGSAMTVTGCTASQNNGWGITGYWANAAYRTAELEDNVVQSNGYQANAAGFTIHSAVHMARHDANAVMHLHTDAGVAVSGMGCGLLPLNQHALFVYQDVAYHEWEGVALNLDERARLIADVGEKHLVVLRNHGTLALGASVASCFMRMYYLERACAIQVQTLSGGAPHPVSRGATDMMAATFGPPMVWEGIAATAWPALLRLAQRRSPGYDQ